MRKPFLITGLPRSRTAWWSVLTTTPVSTCAHEPMKDCKSFVDLVALWDRPGPPYSGVSDATALYVINRVLSEMQARTLMIDRPLADVAHSLHVYFKGMAYDERAVRRTLDEMKGLMTRWRDHPLVKRVAFDQLNNQEIVEECFSWLMPGAALTFRPELMHMNIQADAAYVERELKKERVQWWRG
jgi:hypothetical protein